MDTKVQSRAILVKKCNRVITNEMIPVLTLKGMYVCGKWNGGQGGELGAGGVASQNLCSHISLLIWL